MITTKKELSLTLSSLHSTEQHSPHLEQYATPSEIAADALWFAHLSHDLYGLRVADLGCGNGILGCGAWLLGAKHVNFLDVDPAALTTTKKNVNLLEEKTQRHLSSTFFQQDVSTFKKDIDCIIQNPPFGVQEQHADRAFLAAALQAPAAYSFHKSATRTFVQRFITKHSKTAILLKTYPFPLWKTMTFHTKRVRYADVDLWRIS